MTDVDGNKLKFHDKVWVYCPEYHRLRLAKIRKFKDGMADVVWVERTPGDTWSGVWVGPNNLLYCAGQD